MVCWNNFTKQNWKRKKEVAQEQLILISDPYNHFEPRQAVIPLAKRNSMLQEAYGTHFGPLESFKKQWKLFSRSSRLESTTCKKPFSHRHAPKHSLKVASSCVPTTRCSCPMILNEATDCQHTNHYWSLPKAIKSCAALLHTSRFSAKQPWQSNRI